MLEDLAQDLLDLTRISVFDNPLTEAGIRSMLRVISLPRSKRLRDIVHVGLGDFSASQIVFQKASALEYDPAAVGYNVNADLSSPYDRAVVRMYIKRAVTLNMSFDAAFRNFTIDGERKAPNFVLHDTTWELPLSGLMTFEVSLRPTDSSVSAHPQSRPPTTSRATWSM